MRESQAAHQKPAEKRCIGILFVPVFQQFIILNSNVMKENKNKNSQRGGQQNAEKQNTGTGTPDKSSSGGIQRQADTVNTKEKKPYSHKTGDATNFGDRSYQED